MEIPRLHPRSIAPDERNSVHLPELAYPILNGGKAAPDATQSPSNTKEPQMPCMAPLNACMPKLAQANTVSAEE